MFLSNLLIALREGVEASLIVGILVAYLVKVGRRDVLPKVWLGIFIATVIPLGIGAFMTWGPYTLTFQAQEIIGGTLSIMAACFITWMIFWMSSHSATLARDLQRQVSEALRDGSAATIVWLAIISVGREGIETAVFVWATVKSTASTSVIEPTLGMLCGILGAILIGYLVYAGATRINLRRFFTVTGFMLIFVAAGVVSYGFGDLQEAGLLPGIMNRAYDLSPYMNGTYSSLLTMDSPLYVVFEAMFQFNLNPTLLQVVSWWGYLVASSTAFFVVLRRNKVTQKVTSKTAS